MSIINDKFKIISFHDKNLKIHDICDNYFQNIIINNQKSVSPSYIHSLLWNSLNVKKEITMDKMKDSINSIVEKNISVFLKLKRNELRNANKKNNLTLNILIEFMNLYIKRLVNIKNSLIIVDKKNVNEKKKIQEKIYGFSNIIDIGISEFCKKILSDNIIVNLIKNNMKDENFDKESFIIFYKLVNNFSVYYDENEIWFIDLVGKSLIESFERKDYSFLLLLNNGEKFYNLYEFSDISKYYDECLSKFSFIKNNDVFKYILDDLFNLIEKILKVDFNKCDNSLFILNYFYNFVNKFSQNIIFFIKNNKDNIFKLSNILDLFDPYDYKNILYSVSYYNIILEILIKSFISDKFWIFKNKIISKLNNEKSLKILLSIINSNILNKYNETIKNNNVNESKNIEINNTILYSILSMTKLNDFVFSELKKYLSTRLLNNKNNDDNFKRIEEEDFENLKNNFDKKYTFDLSKMYYDYNTSLSLKNDYLELNNNPFNGNMIVTSYDTWDINISEGNLKKIESDIHNSKILKHFYKFSIFYNLKYKNKRYLICYPHLGSLRMTFNCKKKVKLIMLPIHGIFLDNLSNIDKINYDMLINKVKEISTYSLKFLSQVLISLIDLNILKNNSDNMVSINVDYNDLDEINVSEYFFNNSYLDEKWNDLRKEKLAHSRERILVSVINSYLKKIKNGTDKETIYKNISKNFKRFIITNELFEKVINYMIEKDYINYNEEFKTYCKIYY
jgi:hypothetical protein